jgi:hypothetical protein
MKKNQKKLLSSKPEMQVLLGVLMNSVFCRQNINVSFGAQISYIFRFTANQLTALLIRAITI